MHASVACLWAVAAIIGQFRRVAQGDCRPSARSGRDMAHARGKVIGIDTPLDARSNIRLLNEINSETSAFSIKSDRCK